MKEFIFNKIIKRYNSFSKLSFGKIAFQVGTSHLKGLT